MSETSRFYGKSDRRTLDAAIALAECLVRQNRYHEAKKLLCVAVADAEDAYGDDFITLQLKQRYARALWKFHFYGYDDYRDDLRKAMDLLEDTLETTTELMQKFYDDDDIPEELISPGIISRSLHKVRETQLDWCIHDLTPATLLAYGFDEEETACAVGALADRVEARRDELKARLVRLRAESERLRV